MIIHQNPLIGNKWCLPFLGSDKPVVMRSQRHFYFHDKKRPTQFNVYFTVGSLLSTVLFAMFASVIGLMAQFSCGRNLLRKVIIFRKTLLYILKIFLEMIKEALWGNFLKM